MLLVCLFMGNVLFSYAASSNDLTTITKNPELESLLSKATPKSMFRKSTN